MAFPLQFWSGKRVLVTGHMGFKGSWLSSWLLDLDAEVIGVGLPSPGRTILFDKLALARRLTSIVMDVRNSDALSRCVASIQPEVVFHLAAQPLVFEGFADPLATFETNVLGAVNLLEALRRSPGTRAIVVVTSDKCYRQPHADCTENDPLGGADPYSASKACAELVTHAYRQCFLTFDRNVGLASARAGNVIGAGDFSPNRLVPDLIRAISRGDTAYLRHPDAVRPWQHVIDALWGYLLLAQALYEDPQTYSTGWNFGPQSGKDWTVGELATALVRAYGSGDWRPAEAATNSEVAHLCLSSVLARVRLGWRPQLDHEEMVAWTVAGYRALLESGSNAWLSRQLREFEKRVGDSTIRCERINLSDLGTAHHELAHAG